METIRGEYGLVTRVEGLRSMKLFIVTSIESSMSLQNFEKTVPCSVQDCSGFRMKRTECTVLFTLTEQESTQMDKMLDRHIFYAQIKYFSKLNLE